MKKPLLYIFPVFLDVFPLFFRFIKKTIMNILNNYFYNAPTRSKILLKKMQHMKIALRCLVNELSADKNNKK